MSASYKYKSLSLEAHRFAGFDEPAGPDWMRDAADSGEIRVLRDMEGREWAEVVTPGGHQVARPGDWILRHPDGSLEAMADRQFRLRYSKDGKDGKASKS